MRAYTNQMRADAVGKKCSGEPTNSMQNYYEYLRLLATSESRPRKTKVARRVRFLDKDGCC